MPFSLGLLNLFTLFYGLVFHLLLELCLFTLDVSHICMHPKYDKKTDDYDIALLHLKTPIKKFNATMSPVCLPTGSTNFPSGNVFFYFLTRAHRVTIQNKWPENILETRFFSEITCLFVCFQQARNVSWRVLVTPKRMASFQTNCAKLKCRSDQSTTAKSNWRDTW